MKVLQPHVRRIYSQRPPRTKTRSSRQVLSRHEHDIMYVPSLPLHALGHAQHNWRVQGPDMEPTQRRDDNYSVCRTRVRTVAYS